jgi:hypothetical protein
MPGNDPITVVNVLDVVTVTVTTRCCPLGQVVLQVAAENAAALVAH